MKGAARGRQELKNDEDENCDERAHRSLCTPPAARADSIFWGGAEYIGKLTPAWQAAIPLETGSNETDRLMNQKEMTERFYEASQALTDLGAAQLAAQARGPEPLKLGY